MKVGIIGGGAAGFFTAINIAEKCPHAKVTILEKTGKVLQKVKVSGGGRCNVTNGREQPSELVPFYPRGGKKLYRPLSQFGTTDMRSWLSEHGVATKVEEDLRAFPVSNSSQTIIDCFLHHCLKLKIDVQRNQVVTGIFPNDQWRVKTTTSEHDFDIVIIATGSSEMAWKWLEPLGLQLVPRVPSLFTFNIKDPRLQGLQGLAFPDAQIKIAGTKLRESGPLLITHWGLSGPAVLKLSSVGARELADRDYQFQIIVSFPHKEAEAFRAELQASIHSNPKKQLGNLKVAGCPERYWTNLLKFLGIKSDGPLGELSKKDINRLTEEITQASFTVTGKSTFKEEFVTSGGVALSEIDLNSMEAKKHPGLYFAGEVLNIDALTGGFNFQSCWTAGWLISDHIKTL